MGSSNDTPSTTTQTTEIPKYLRPYVKEVAAAASDAYSQVPQGGFSGQLTAAPADEQQQALNVQRNIVRGLDDAGNQAGTLAEQQAQRIASGDIRNTGEAFQTQSADTAGVIQAALDPVRQDLVENIIPQIQSQAIQQGAYGGTRQDVVTQQALENYSQQAGNIAAAIGYDDFARQEDQRFQDTQTRLGLMPQLESLEQSAIASVPGLESQSLQQQLQVSDILSAIGGTEQAFDQQALDEAYQQYALNTQTPFAGLDQYASILGGIPSGSTSTVTGTTPSTSSGGLSGAISGGLGGYGLASSMAALTPYTWPIAGIGAIAGGFL